CALLGVPGDAPLVRISRKETTGALKESIKEEVPEVITCAARDLQLYVARDPSKGDADRGEWLSDEDESLLTSALQRGEVDGAVKALLGGAAPMKATGMLQSIFDKLKMPPPSTKQIHILVQLPSAGRVGTRAEQRDQGVLVLEPAIKRLKTTSWQRDHGEASGASAAQFSMEKVELEIDPAEFDLDALSEKVGSRIGTPGLHAFWSTLGEFPPGYHVRKEEEMFWAVVKQLLLSTGKSPVVILGSPGVGKSCFLVLLAFYVAYFQNRKVLVIRQLKSCDRKNAVVFLKGKDGEHERSSGTSWKVSVYRAFNLSAADIDAVREAEMTRGSLVLVDGYTQKYVKANDSLRPFNILATSCQYDKKSDDPATMVVLPAWRFEDLLGYVLSNRSWLVETKQRAASDGTSEEVIRQLVAEHYKYSGGSLRAFCTTREAITRVLTAAAFFPREQSYQLVYERSGARSDDRSNHFYRQYIVDPSNVNHYVNQICWYVSVDSAYALKLLGRHNLRLDKYLEYYRHAETVGAGYLGLAYESLLHRAVSESIGNGKHSVEIALRVDDSYERIVLDVKRTWCSGENKADCHDALTILDENTYWHPDYPLFPFVDAVTTCDAFAKGSEEPERVLAYVQVTIRDRKTFTTADFAALDEVMERNTKRLPTKRIFVVVTNKVATRDSFTLTVEDGASCPTMVGCFDPGSLEERGARVWLSSGE
ncbi:hypothetical protein BBJ28_00025976, partial [Nothophytophthora sp. Chile5]